MLSTVMNWRRVLPILAVGLLSISLFFVGCSADDDPEDETDQFIYWTDLETRKIQRANLDGSNIQDIITGLEKPAGIALGFSIPSQSTPR